MSLKNSRSLSGKIILALCIACGAIFMAWSITTLTFQRILSPLQQLSQQDPRSRVVDKLFRDIVALDQQQRLQVMRGNAKNYLHFISQSKQIRLTLDTLQSLSLDNDAQLKRIDTMKKMLSKRNRIFTNYIRLRQDFIANDTLSSQIKTLAEFVNNPSLRTDSNVVTTEKKTTTTTLQDMDTALEEPKQNFWDKLWGRKRDVQPKKLQN